MTDINIHKQMSRKRRHARVRAKISGTADRPRIAVFKSNRGVYAQAIDDVARTTIAAVNDVMLKKTAKKTKKDMAQAAGAALAELLVKKGITRAVFDASGFAYQGRVQAVADALREGGITV